MPQRICCTATAAICIVSCRPGKVQRSLKKPCICDPSLICIIFFVTNITVISRIKVDSDDIAVIVHIQNCGPFRYNYFVRIKGCTVESCVSFLCSIYSDIASLIVRIGQSGVNVASILYNSINGSTNIAGQVDGFRKIISFVRGVNGIVYALLPDNNRIISSCFRNPLGIDRRSFADRTAKRELISVRAILIRIPAAEGIAISDHFKQARITGHFTRLNETRRVISTAFAVFIKYEPVAFRCAYRKLEVSFDFNIGTVREKCLSSRT